MQKCYSSTYDKLGPHVKREEGNELQIVLKVSTLVYMTERAERQLNVVNISYSGCIGLHPIKDRLRQLSEFVLFPHCTNVIAFSVHLIKRKQLFFPLPTLCD
jgi:hypothetical protein